MTPLLAADEPAAVGCRRPHGTSPFFLVCDHAAARIPRALGDLGVSAAERARHIAWDIGALAVAEHLSEALDATLVWQNYSRLVIDCNRPPHSVESIIERSEATDVPGNHGLDAAARAARRAALFDPYHDTIAGLLDMRAARETLFVAVHSFTPVYHGVSRPWALGVMYGADTRLARALLAVLARDADFCVGDNQPYQVDELDHTLPAHPLARGLPNVLLELRQDLVTDAGGQRAWATRLAAFLGAAAERLHRC